MFIAGSVSLVNGVFRSQISSGTGMIISLQDSTDLIHWQTLQTVTNVSGVFTLTDTNAAHWPNAFYRAVIP